jgi:hypothetical protein
MPPEASAYWWFGSEAKFRNRSAGYEVEHRIYLIEKIEVG